MIDLALDGRVFIDTELDAALQELDLLFNTENTELIGYPSYGTNFEQFLWQMTPSPNELEKYINEKITSNTFFLKRMERRINVEILDGQMRDIYHVTINLYNPSSHTQGQRIYQLR
jgi:hypothetical protein